MAFKEPLFLPTPNSEEDKTRRSPKFPDLQLSCMLCEETFPPTQSQDFLRHLLEVHSLVIEDAPAIADLAAYCRYWKQRLMTTELSWVCARIDTTENKTFFMLTKMLPEDLKLRDELRRKRQEEILKPLLEQKQKERADESTVRSCLFCRKTFQGKPHDLFQHMYVDHNFNVGRADNLVHVDEFLALLHDNLSQLRCLYCEKTFKSWDVLKEHMRKKQHKHLNPNNTAYDRFYIVSYLLGEYRPAGDGGERDADVDDEPDRFEDWTEEQHFDFICLFCDRCDKRFDDAFEHMRQRHAFDFGAARAGLGFYDQVKLVNYIRRQTHVHVCYLCATPCAGRAELLDHLDAAHADGGVVPRSLWDKPGYFFPTYENDQLLLALEDNADEANEEWVVPEDTVEPNTELLEQLSLRGDDDL
ncbi:zinc finger protein-like [Tropilaelaps mercedesae]|uniref:Zinc finger protein-like n=1 Tax=Tropilaelaps mercedesae TaxID=418985 RepID=A0A1V9XTX1_9ACAR|nr:zinc finger protein-like [Tropilaelaps mercedesae]